MVGRDLNDAELLRYSRHVLLDEIGIEGQRRISQATVLVVGAGGLGCPSALYLASAGVGTLILADPDEVDLTNLQRQVLHTTARVGMSKVKSAHAQLHQINPDIHIECVAQRLEGSLLNTLVQRADLVLDCSDNFATRYAINRACVQHSTPLVSGSAIGLDGQLACFELNNPQAPCYHCLFPEGDDVSEIRCATMGVFAPLTGVIGTLQACEALKVLGGFGLPMFNVLQLFNARDGQFARMHFSKDPECGVCRPNPKKSLLRI